MIQNWPRVRALFESALDMPEDERRAFVSRESNGDTRVETDVLRLLSRARADDSFLVPPGSRDVLDALAARPTLAAGDQVAGYRIERLIGRGGMGSVYAARQERPDRLVALKVMGGAIGSDAARRFELEAETLALLRHPGIATVYEMGLHRRADGSELSFFAMELVEGALDLVRFAREADLDETARLDLFREVCDAVHYAHQRGVIHRDLKPGNILVDANGNAKVIDYGVACTSEPGLARGFETQDGALIGTLQYISPEQLAGGVGSAGGADVRSDVYALGVILYELVAHALPYEVDGKPITKVLAEVCDHVPAPPSSHRPGVARELDWIVMKALAKDRDRRYDSAAELAEDLARFARAEPVLAGPESTVYRTRKFIQRHRLIVAAVALTCASLVGGTIASGLALVEARERRAQADAARNAASTEADRARMALEQKSALLLSVQRTLRAEREARDPALAGILAAKTDTSALDDAEAPAARAKRLAELAHTYREIGLAAEATSAAEDALAALAASNALADPDRELRRDLKLFLTRQRILETDFDGAADSLAESRSDFENAENQGDEPEKSRAEIIAQRLEAELMEKNGRIEAAAAAYRSTLADSERALGPNDPVTVTLMTELGLVLAGLGSLEEAEDLTQRAYHRAREALGPTAPQVHLAAMRLGLVRRQLGDVDGLVELQQSVVDGAIAAFGEVHRNVPIAMYALADAQNGKGDLRAAEETATRALDLVLTHHPDDVELEVYVCQPLVVALTRLDQGEDAIALLEENVLRMLDVGMTQHPRLAEIRTLLGALYLSSGRPDDAERELREALELASATLPVGHARRLDARAQLGAALQALERFEEAEHELRGAFDGFRSSSDPAAEKRALELLPGLVEVYGALNREDERARFAALLPSD